MTRPNRYTLTDQIADYLADDLPVAEIMALTGKTRAHVDQTTHRIRKRLGEQSR